MQKTQKAQSISDELEETFGDVETRRIVTAEHITTAVPIQIHEMREARGWTQKELAERVGMAQERISVLEDPNYGFFPKISTLLKFAEIFDVPLIVRFGTWTELLKWDRNPSSELLALLSFDQEKRLRSAQLLAQKREEVSGQFSNAMSVMNVTRKSDSYALPALGQSPFDPAAQVYCSTQAQVFTA